jgi:hypothetical protein
MGVGEEQTDQEVQKQESPISPSTETKEV